MADIQYNVEVRYHAVGDLGEPLRNQAKFQRVRDTDHAKYFAKVGAAADNVAARFSSAWDAAASSLVSTMTVAGATAGAAVAAGLGKALHAGIDFASTIESSQIGIASIKTMMQDVPFPRALQQSAVVIEGLRRKMARLPGEFRDGLEMYSSISPAGAQLGLSDKRMLDMSTRGVAVAAALGINQATFAHELSSALGGRVTSAMPLARKLGLHQAEWKKLKPEERVDYFEKLFTKADPGIEAYASSWQGLTSSAKDNSRNVARSFAAPLFATLKGELGRGLDWFGSNEDAVHAFATRLGVRVDYIFRSALDKIREWGPAALAFGNTLASTLGRAFDRVGPHIARLETVALHFARDPKALDKAAHVAASLAALRVGAGALQMGGAGMSGLGGLLGGAGSGASALGAALPFAVAGIAAFALAAEGATHALLDSSSQYHDVATSKAAEIGLSSAVLVKDLAAFNASTRDTRDALGTGLLYAVNGAVKSFDRLVVGANAVVEANSWYAESIANNGRWLRAQIGMMSEDASPQIERKGVELRPIKALNWAPDPDEDRDGQIKLPKIHQTVHQNIEIRVEPNTDPNRFVSMVSDRLKRENDRAALDMAGGIYRK